MEMKNVWFTEDMHWLHLLLQYVTRYTKLGMQKSRGILSRCVLLP